MSATVYRVLVGLLAVVAAGCAGPRGRGPGGVEVGRPVPEFALPALDGRTVTSRSLEGEVVVLAFWASWCPSCVAEIPALKRVAAEPGVKVIGVALDKDWPGAVQRCVQRHGITYPVLGGDEELFERFDGSALPYTLVLDRSQQVARIYRGPVSAEALERDVRTLREKAR
jgi:peroxiredoxin